MSWLRRRPVLAVQMAIIAIPLNRHPSGFANRVFERSDRLLLRSRCAGHVEDFFFHDRPVQIVRAVTERDLGERQSGAYPIGRQMIDVIEIDTTDRKITQLLNRRCPLDMSKESGLRFKRERNESAESTGFVLELPELTQMINPLLEGFDVA